MLLNKNYTQNCYPAFSGQKYKIKNYGVSQNFVKEIEQAKKQYPDSMLKAISKIRKSEIRLAPYYSDAFPDYPEVQQAIKGATVPGTKLSVNESACGASLNLPSKKNFVCVMEEPRKGKRNVKGDFSHELTHEIDKVFEKHLGERFTKTKEFQNEIKKDLLQLEVKKKKHPKLFAKYEKDPSETALKMGVKRFDYLTQKSTPNNINPYGASEIFAQCGAELTTGLSIKGLDKKDKFMQTFFTNTFDYTKKLFSLLGMKTVK